MKNTGLLYRQFWAKFGEQGLEAMGMDTLPVEFLNDGCFLDRGR